MQCASQRGVRTSLCDAVARDKCGTVQDWTRCTASVPRPVDTDAVCTALCETGSHATSAAVRGDWVGSVTICLATASVLELRWLPGRFSCCN